ncbi:MAG: hypothetical protein WBS24_01700 [Terriglobales bacterium]
MDSSSRLCLISRIAYYAGWLFALCGALVHFGLGAVVLRNANLPKRNLFEASVMLFLISATSALRAIAAGKAAQVK